MIELPEGLTLAKQIDSALTGTVVERVQPPSAPHKFCWFNGDPSEYHERLAGQRIEGARSFGIFVEIAFDGGARLCFNDGVNVRLLAPETQRPKKYQLLMEFADGRALAFTVAMYGGIICHAGDYDNEYYRKSKGSVSPLSASFDKAAFDALLASVKPTLSAKAFLATEQRIPGLGNGVLQDILFQARIHPKRKVGTLSESERADLFYCVKAVLEDMAARGGRDTEKDIYGQAGGYRTLLSKNTLTAGCPHCGGGLVKEAYLGGAVYYCPSCQPLEK